AAVVTGASRGIGRHVALALAAEGCRVLACGRDTGAPAPAPPALAPAAVPFPVDVTAPEAAEAMVAGCLEAFGRLDVVVNNAGTAAPKPLAELTAADWHAGPDVSVRG